MDCDVISRGRRMAVSTVAAMSQSSDMNGDYTPTNGEILEVWKANNKPKMKGYKAVLALCGKEETDYSYSSIVTNVEALGNKRKNDARHSSKAEMDEWLQKPYCLPVPRPPSTTLRPEPPTTACECQTLRAVNDGLGRDFAKVNKQLETAEKEILRLTKKCERLEHQVEKMEQKKAKKVAKSEKRRMSLSAANQAVKRKEAIENKLRNDLAMKKIHLRARDSTIRQLRQKLENRPEENKVQKPKRRRVSRTSKKLTAECDRIKAENTQLRKDKVEAEKLADHLYAEKEEAATQNKSILDLKSDKKTYNAVCRWAIYICLTRQVPVEWVSDIIMQLVQKLTGVTIIGLPDKTTICRMAYEMGVLSDLRVGEVLATAKNITLAWDSTSIEGRHMNEVHITTETISLILQIDTIPGGKTEDYVRHITECIRDVVSTYAQYAGRDINSLVFQVQQNIKNTMSDRAAVNHCVSEALANLFDTQLLELKCLLHPLDGLAKGAIKTLKELDQEYKIPSDTYGSEGRAVNFIRTLAKMRHVQGTGDPGGFTQFLRDNNIPQGLIVRYVGNRIHVMFHLAGILYSLREQIVYYLKKKCAVGNSMRAALIKDYNNKDIMLQVRALGLLGKVLTGPYMRWFYTPEEEMGHLDHNDKIRECMASLHRYQNDPHILFTTKEDVFGNNIADSVLTSLQGPLEAIEETKLIKIIQQLVGGCIEVINRQLERYLKGDLANPSDTLKSQARSASVHNFYAERVLGQTDAASRRAPNATAGFIDGKVKFKKNDILEWLESFSESERERMTSFARSEGAKVRDLRRKRAQRTRDFISARQKERSHQRDEKVRRALEKQIRIAMEKKQDLEEKDGMTPDQLQRVNDILRNPECLPEQYQYIDHLYEEKGHDVLYHGCIQCVEIVEKKGKSRKVSVVVTISYWQETQTETDSTDKEDVDLVSIVADYIVGDLVFLTDTE